MAYHAGKNRTPLCGAKGSGNGYHIVVLTPKEWNALAESLRCKRCIAKLQAMRKVVQ